MKSDDNNLDLKYCADDDEYRVYCNICDEPLIERYCKTQIKSGTHINLIHIKRRIKVTKTNKRN